MNHGANPGIADSETAYVGAGVQITADAISAGNGGKVVVWSDDTTEFDGAISARGGALAGNGGSAEVSGKVDLAFNGGVDLSAAHGASGSLLLDPTNITIDNTGTNDSSFNLAGGVETIAATDTPSAMSISAAKIESLLQTNAVSISASTSIDVTQAIDASGVLETNALTLAAPTIQFETGANITTGGGGLTLSGNVQLAGTGTITLSTAPTGATGGNLIVTGTIDGGQKLSTPCRRRYDHSGWSRRQRDGGEQLNGHRRPSDAGRQHHYQWRRRDRFERSGGRNAGSVQRDVGQFNGQWNDQAGGGDWGGNNLTLTNGGAATLGGAISGVNVLTANGGGTLQVNAAISASSLGDSEATTLNATSSPAVTTTGDQGYSGAVTLTQATTLNSTTIELTGGVSFAGNNLTLNNTGQATVGGSFTEFNRLTFVGSLALGQIPRSPGRRTVCRR